MSLKYHVLSTKTIDEYGRVTYPGDYILKNNPYPSFDTIPKARKYAIEHNYGWVWHIYAVDKSKKTWKYMGEVTRENHGTMYKPKMKNTYIVGKKKYTVYKTGRIGRRKK